MYDHELVQCLYKKMALIRRLELRLAEVYHTDVIKSPVHLSVGQESIAVGVCHPLEQGDMVSNTYRCHATYIAKGGCVKAMMAELYGKATGCAGGKAGSMHLVDIKNGIMGASAVVGTTIPVAAGYAWALKMQAQKQKTRQRVVVAVFGDGATEEGCFSETLNFAALHKLPIIFICENNGLAIHTPLQKRWATTKLCERVATYDIPVHKIVDADVFKIRDFMVEALTIARAGQGPVFLECLTYRWLEHVGPADDHHDAYRHVETYRQWQEQDQIARLANMLEPETVARLDREITHTITAAEQFAQHSAYPLDQELYAHVYAH